MEISQLISQLKLTPKNVTTIFNDNITLWQSLGFSHTQVTLWLASLSLSKEHNTADQITYDITEHLMSLLQNAGGRMPLTQVLKKLPAGITTSEQQIRRLVQNHMQLEVKGPLLVLVN